LAALSLAADLGMGRPLESAQRTAILTVALGHAAGLGARDLKDAYYAAFLRYVGCTADAPLAAAVLGGDEIAARGWLALVDGGKPTEMIRVLARHIAAGQSAMARARVMASLLLKVPRLAGAVEAQCEVAQALADDLGCSVRVREALAHSFERWDGKGAPRRKKGEAIPLAMRVVQVADDAQVFHRAGGGVAAATAMLAARAGRGLDPTLAETLRAGAGELLATLDVAPVWDAVIAAEPGAPDYLRDGALDGALQAMGAFADLKSSYTRGHSTGVAELAAGAAERLGLGPESVAEVRRAGYVHDVGRAGVSARVWEKEGPLTDGEWEQVRKHAGYTEQILARPPLLARLGALGALDHERLDGTGYHRRPAASLPPGARLLAAADMYQAMRETRPHRRSLPRDEVAATLEAEAKKGRLDRDAVRAVLATAGHRVERRRTRRSAYPGGLTDREVDVLRLVARGLTDKQAAQKLEISPRMVGDHLAHLYEKIGVTTRAAAAMFAMRNGIVGAV
jgi:HD-GYP domain-containing protein (c-di-GMP phosphodiesterase class II)